MFKNYIKESLSLSDFNQIMKTAPDGQAYCNAFCQKFMNKDDFYEKKANCKICYNQIIKARKMINSNQITIEQFKENPELVGREKTIIPVYRTCITCVKELTIEKYEGTRKECIECRRKKKKINYEKQFEEYKNAIDEVKTDITALNNLFKAMSTDLLKLTVKHYKISISHSDLKKDIIITRVTDHFRSQLNPFICLGNCGSRLPIQFSVCDVCKLNPKNSAEEIMAEFTKNLDELIPEIESMKPEDSFKYNKKQVMLIARKLGLKIYNTMDKPVIMEIIDKHLNDKKEAEVKDILRDLGGEINLNGITVLAREDGFINATALCKAGGKEFKHWNALESTKELVKIIQKNENPTIKITEVDIPTSVISENKSEIINSEIETNNKVQVIDIKKGGNNKKAQGSWIHPDLAVQLAQWISPSFAIQISKWIRELSLTGSVQLGLEKTETQLITLQKEYKKLEDKHRKLLQKKQYHKFKEGAAFYIISDLDGKSVKFKPGFDGVDINFRLQSHRSTMPACKLEYLIYCNDADLVERAVLKKFESKRKFANHEWVYDVDISHIIKNTKTILDVLNITYTEECEIAEYNNQILTDFE